ncbi:MAG: hypothetical protein DRQ39_09145 [Gammaproteobacteria bacterium]|nr:MAG: hypothetical protein DRQ39_09145 [Gammaproteobacteria bacterium]RKZ96078.1 MAG: hypothetical protein DRQ40_01975 [Gammaproteobacteria bacterium]
MTQGDRKRTKINFSTNVKFSAKGFAFSEDGTTRRFLGIIPFVEEADKLPFREYPQLHGVLIYNRTTQCLELSDPDNSKWICFSGSIPVPVVGDFASHLGTTDGNSIGLLVDPSFSTGRVASPTSPGSPYYAGGFDNDTNQDITATNVLPWNGVPANFITDLQAGSITVTYKDGNGNILVQEVLNPDGSLINQSSGPNGYVQITSLQDNLDKVEGYLQVSIPANSLLGDTGYLLVEAVQEIDTVSYPQSLEFFLDKGNAPSFSSQGVELDTAVVDYLSGIKYASTGSTLKVDLDSDDMWKDTYRADLLEVQATSLGLGTYLVNYSAATISGGTQPPSDPFNHDDPFIYSEVKAISAGISNPDSSGVFQKMRFQLRDPFNTTNGSLFSASPEVLIHTLSDTSTGRQEDFVSESFRLILGSGSITDIEGVDRDAREWDSTQSLTVSGGLQIMPGALIYPQTDFSSIDPSINPDYSGIPAGSLDLSYSRQFIDTVGVARSNGVLTITGLTEAARLSGAVLIDLRVVGTHIPGNGTQGFGNEGTGWLSLNTNYNIATFKGDNTDGCFVTTGSFVAPDFEFTLGGFSTVFAENKAVEVRVTYVHPAGVSTRITRIEMSNWT